MLQDQSYADVASWTPPGNSFIIRDPSEFSKRILPRHFRHSNFASFVRQLNKYDFHKVKRKVDRGHDTETGLEGDILDQTWEFKHPRFLRNHEEMLREIKVYYYYSLIL